jgi:hypothetical protein
MRALTGENIRISYIGFPGHKIELLSYSQKFIEDFSNLDKKLEDKRSDKEILKRLLDQLLDRINRVKKPFLES